MGEFKVIFRRDLESNDDLKPTWEPGCPLQFNAIQVSRNTESGEAFLQGKISNVSAAKTQSFKATVKVKYKDGSEETIEFAPLDADIAPRALYTLKPAKLRQGDAIAASGKIEVVDTEKGTWQTTGQALPIPTPEKLGLYDTAVKERYEQVFAGCRGRYKNLLEAAANAVREEDGWWLCPCGQVNVGREACAKCGVELEKLKESEKLDNKDLMQAAAQREINEQEEQARKERKRKKMTKLAIKIGAIVAIVIVAIVLVVNLLVIPAQKSADYEKAETCLSQGNYSEAIEIYDSLGDYEDATMLAEHAREMEPFVNNNSLSVYVYGKNSSDSERCELTFWADGTCSLNIEENSSAAKELGFSGSWQGSWDIRTLEVRLQGYPLGEDWHFNNFQEQEASRYRNYYIIAGDVAYLQTDGSNAKFRIFARK